MKLKLAFKCLPYLLSQKDLGGNKKGGQKYCFIELDDEPLPTTLPHEHMHLLWWYSMTAFVTLALWFFMPLFYASAIAIHVDPVLSQFSKWYRGHREMMAYAYATQYADNPLIYLEELTNSKPHQDKYGANWIRKVQVMYNKNFKGNR